MGVVLGYSTTVASTLEQCIQYCDMLTGSQACKALSWGQGRTECVLYPSNIGGGNGNIYYDVAVRMN